VGIELPQVIVVIFFIVVIAIDIVIFVVTAAAANIEVRTIRMDVGIRNASRISAGKPKWKPLFWKIILSEY
jgi:hypothetical protein